MKKISLKGISESLTQREMKNVRGGCGNTCFRCSDGYECYCEPNDSTCLDDLAEMCTAGWISWDC